MRFKDSSIGAQSLKPQIVLALMVIDGVFRQNDIELVITSINDARHSKTSLHYDGAAVDIRSRTTPDKEFLLKKCKEALGNSPDFDMILESDHYHLEYQPKRR